jgi:hypothetical protein
MAAAGVPLAGPGAASAQGNDLQGLEVAAENVFIPTTVNSVSAGTIQAGFWNWYSFLWNRSPTTVTNATISVMSGYAPSHFNDVTAFPYTSTDPSPLPSNQPYAAGTLWPKYTLPQNMIHANYSLGFGSSRTLSPAVIPVGGTQQTLTITVTPVDSRYLPASNQQHVTLDIIFRSNVPGVTVVSTTNPGNLNQGEQLQTPSNPPGLFQWQLYMPRLAKTYTFTAVLNVPNATGAPFAYLPEVQIGGEKQTIAADNVSGTAVTVTDPTLDGSTSGSGAVTFSVAETGHLWQAVHSDTWGMFYQGTEPAANATPVTIVVKPWSGPVAPINPTSQGTIPVAILSTSSFDATTVDVATVRFGVFGTEATSAQSSTEDVNGDGIPDLVLHFPTQSTGITCGTTAVTLTGQTTSGQQFRGTAPITTPACQ